jgi:hypothetical protein
MSGLRVESYWMDSTEPTSYPPATADLEVDVAVLEADRIAGGVTGYTTAKLTALHTLI